jgi:hypothetical protein
MMERIVIPTKFNKTGKRVLSLPLDERRVYAPAYQHYQKAHHEAQEEWKHKRDSAKQAYVESIAHWIASYIAGDSTPVEQKYNIAKFLAGQSLAERGPMNITGPNSLQRWSVQLGNVLELASVEEKTWKDYITATNKADAEKDAALAKARSACDEMKRALAREISDHTHHQYHPDDAH